MTAFLNLSWYFRQHWRAYGIAVAMLSCVAVLNLVPAAVVGYVVDGVAARTLDGRELALASGGIAATAVLVYVLRYGWRSVLYGTSYRLAVVLRERIYQQLLRQSPAFYQRWSTGDLMARATNDVTAVELLAGEGVLTLFDGVLTGALVLGVMSLVFSWKLTLLALLPWPVMAWYMYQFGEQLHVAFDGAQAQFSRLNDCVQEHVGGIRAVKSFGQEALAAERFAAIAADTSRANLAVARVDARYDPVISLTVGASFGLSVAGGAWLIHSGELSIGQLTSFTMYLTQLIWPMFAYGWLMSLVERGSAAYNRINELLDTPPAMQDDGQRETLAEASLRVDISDFRYRAELPPALANIHFQLPAGATLGIVGPTGAGKTTLLNLLLRLYEAPGVQIHLGGEQLQHYRLDALRRLMAVVPQDPFLFSTSIAENIALGCPGASPSEVERCAQLASLDDDIRRFPEGYRTRVGERGVTLSGGQKQRVGIARALMMGAPVLLLDDALSAVDAATERRILDHLNEASRGLTRVIVSHRLSAVEDADLILVLEHGQLLERGSHEALLAAGGWYAHTWRYQQMEEVVRAGH